MWGWVVLYILSGLLLLLVFVLCVPLVVAFDWDANRQPRTTIRVEWFFGLIRFTPQTKTTLPREPSPQKKKRKKLGPSKVLRIITIKGLFKKAARLVKSWLKQIKLKKLEGDIKIEFDDPADAGKAFAVLGASYPIIRLTRLSKVRVEPVLGDDIGVRGNFRAVVSLQPIRLVAPALRFMLSKPGLLVMKTVIAG